MNKTDERKSMVGDLTLRHGRLEDIDAIAELALIVLTADGDPFHAFSAQELANAWKNEGFNHETDTWVVTTSDGRIVGYEEFENRQAHAFFAADGYVHPDFRGRGIGAAMLRALDERALYEMQFADPDLRVYLLASSAANDANVRSMFEDVGYRVIRYHWTMEVNLTDAPPVKPFPTGIELRPFDNATQDYLVFQAEDEAFQDHWGHVPGNFNNWKLRKIEREAFDPSLWYIAWDADRIAGFSQTRFRSGIGWVGTLGVRRPWRNRGLGEALLLHSFNEFYKRGMNAVGLGVDASNPTGATRLYQKVGMKVIVEDIIVEKEFRPGRGLE